MRLIRHGGPHTFALSIFVDDLVIDPSGAAHEPAAALVYLGERLFLTEQFPSCVHAGERLRKISDACMTRDNPPKEAANDE